MNSIKSLNNRMGKIKASMPTERVQKTREFRFDLFTEDENSVCRAFFASLPFELIKGEWDFSLLSRAQIDMLGNWLQLEDALKREDATEASRIREILGK
jgi:hypothetical protein